MLGKEATKAPTSEEVDEWARIVTMKGYHIVPNVVPIDFITQIKAHYLEIFNAHTQSVSLDPAQPDIHLTIEKGSNC